MSTFINRLKRMWQRRQRYRSFSSWFASGYEGLLHRYPSYPLPRRHYPTQLSLAALRAPLVYRRGTSDWAVIVEVLFEDEYADVLKAVPSNAALIVDLGSNVGVSLRYWAEHFPDATIVGVEPDPANSEICRRSIAAGALSSRVRVVQACVAAAPGEVYLERAHGQSWAFTMRRDATPTSVRVPALTMLQLSEQTGVDDRPIDLLKCDIEGAEQELFEHCHEWIGRVRHLIVELHGPLTCEWLLGCVSRSGTRFDVLSEKHGASDHRVVFLRQIDRFASSTQPS